MNYQRIYDQLVLKRKLYPVTEGYSEKHHILPKSMGGDNTPSNLVRLSAREHYVAHHLLWRIHRNRSMAFAWHMMAIETHGRNSIKYARNKELRMKALSEMQSGARNHFFGKQHSDEVKEYIRSINLNKVMPQWIRNKISAATKGVPKGPMSDETKAKLSKAHTGKVLSEEHKKKLGESHLGVKHTEESKAKMSQAKLGIPRNEETKQKISLAHKGKTLTATHRANLGKAASKTVKCIETGVVYSSIVEAVTLLGFPLHAKGGISQVCLGHRRKARGLSWEFVL